MSNSTSSSSPANNVHPFAPEGVFLDNCDHYRVHKPVSRWKRFGVIVVLNPFDHGPKHVHVFEDGRRLLKFDIESWRVMEGWLTPRARKALEVLCEEGMFNEES